MKLYILLLSVTFNLLSCTGKDIAPQDILTKATQQLNNWETLSFTAATINADGSKPATSTVYKLKRVNYEPHLKLFFFKEMNKEVSIYYKLTSLAVVENQKKKITTFDYGKDRSIPKYLEAYMSDDDNLLFTAELLSKFKDDFSFVEKSDFNDRQVYVYKLQNYKLWLDAKDATPLKLEIDDGASGKKEIIYSEVVFNEPMSEDLFTHPEKEGYISSVYGIKKEPMLNVKAPNWTLLDLDGKKVSLNDFKGSAIFLEAWVSSCSHCMESLPKVKEIGKEFGDKIKVITVNFDYDLSETKATVKDKDINYLVLQGDAIFDQNYDLRSFPSYFVINSEGTIIYSERGAIEGKKEKALFESLRVVK
ncbi:MAG: redoxin family protein [Gelidibacter sp.]